MHETARFVERNKAPKEPFLIDGKHGEWVIAHNLMELAANVQDPKMRKAFRANRLHIRLAMREHLVELEEIVSILGFTNPTFLMIPKGGEQVVSEHGAKRSVTRDAGILAVRTHIEATDSEGRHIEASWKTSPRNNTNNDHVPLGSCNIALSKNGRVLVRADFSKKLWDCGYIFALHANPFVEGGIRVEEVVDFRHMYGNHINLTIQEDNKDIARKLFTREGRFAEFAIAEGIVDMINHNKDNLSALNPASLNEILLLDDPMLTKLTSSRHSKLQFPEGMREINKGNDSLGIRFQHRSGGSVDLYYWGKDTTENRAGGVKFRNCTLTINQHQGGSLWLSFMRTEDGSNTFEVEVGDFEYEKGKEKLALERVRIKLDKKQPVRNTLYSEHAGDHLDRVSLLHI